MQNSYCELMLRRSVLLFCYEPLMEARTFLWLVKNKNLKTFQIIRQVMQRTGSFNYVDPYTRWLRDP